MNVERLKHQITILEGVAAANTAFNLASWGGIADADTTVGRIESCGTACCAFGYAALDPTFQAQGLELIAWMGGEKRSFTSIADLNAARSYSSHPTFEGEDGIDAAAKFFGITYEQACWLFTPEEYMDYETWCRNDSAYRAVPPEEVIERIRHLLAGGKCELHYDRHEREYGEEN